MERTAAALAALNTGKLPSQKQISAFIDYILSSEAIRVERSQSGGELSQNGQKLARDVRAILTAYRAYGIRKNGDDQLQQALSLLAKADVSALSSSSTTSLNGDTSGNREALSEHRAFASSLRSALEIVAATASLESSNVFSDFLSFARLSLADAAEAVADKVDPTTVPLPDIDEDIEPGERDSRGGTHEVGRQAGEASGQSGESVISGSDARGPPDNPGINRKRSVDSLKDAVEPPKYTPKEYFEPPKYSIDPPKVLKDAIKSFIVPPDSFVDPPKSMDILPKGFVEPADDCVGPSEGFEGAAGGSGSPFADPGITPRPSPLPLPESSLPSQAAASQSKGLMGPTRESSSLPKDADRPLNDPTNSPNRFLTPPKEPFTPPKESIVSHKDSNVPPEVYVAPVMETIHVANDTVARAFVGTLEEAGGGRKESPVLGKSPVSPVIIPDQIDRSREPVDVPKDSRVTSQDPSPARGSAGSLMAPTDAPIVPLINSTPGGVVVKPTEAPSNPPRASVTRQDLIIPKEIINQSNAPADLSSQPANVSVNPVAAPVDATNVSDTPPSAVFPGRGDPPSQPVSPRKDLFDQAAESGKDGSGQGRGAVHMLRGFVDLLRNTGGSGSKESLELVNSGGESVGRSREPSEESEASIDAAKDVGDRHSSPPRVLSRDAPVDSVQTPSGASGNQGNGSSYAIPGGFPEYSSDQPKKPVATVPSVSPPKESVDIPRAPVVQPNAKLHEKFVGTTKEPRKQDDEPVYTLREFLDTNENPGNGIKALSVPLREQIVDPPKDPVVPKEPGAPVAQNQEPIRRARTPGPPHREPSIPPKVSDPPYKDSVDPAKVPSGENKAPVSLARDPSNAVEDLGTVLQEPDIRPSVVVPLPHEHFRSASAPSGFQKDNVPPHPTSGSDNQVKDSVSKENEVDAQGREGHNARVHVEMRHNTMKPAAQTSDESDDSSSKLQSLLRDAAAHIAQRARNDPEYRRALDMIFDIIRRWMNIGRSSNADSPAPDNLEALIKDPEKDLILAIYCIRKLAERFGGIKNVTNMLSALRACVTDIRNDEDLYNLASDFLAFIRKTINTLGQRDFDEFEEDRLSFRRRWSTLNDPTSERSKNWNDHLYILRKEVSVFFETVERDPDLQTLRKAQAQLNAHVQEALLKSIPPGQGVAWDQAYWFWQDLFNVYVPRFFSCLRDIPVPRTDGDRDVILDDFAISSMSLLPGRVSITHNTRTNIDIAASERQPAVAKVITKFHIDMRGLRLELKEIPFSYKSSSTGSSKVTGTLRVTLPPQGIDLEVKFRSFPHSAEGLKERDRFAKFYRIELGPVGWSKDDIEVEVKKSSHQVSSAELKPSVVPFVRSAVEAAVREQIQTSLDVFDSVVYDFYKRADAFADAGMASGPAFSAAFWSALRNVQKSPGALLGGLSFTSSKDTRSGKSQFTASTDSLLNGGERRGPKRPEARENTTGPAIDPGKAKEDAKKKEEMKGKGKDEGKGKDDWKGKDDGKDEKRQKEGPRSAWRSPAFDTSG